MKLTADRDALLDALQVASRAVSTRSTLPSLGGILMTASAGEAIVRATDMELGLTIALEAGVEGEGSVLLPGRLLADLARALPRGEVTISERTDKG
ncbi:MAG: DNA polymerase III subunit beta, partial [Solirubrobacterales bacterium]